MGAVTVCGISGGGSYTDTLMLTHGFTRNTWSNQNGSDFGETDLEEYVDRFNVIIDGFMYMFSWAMWMHASAQVEDKL